MFRYLPPVSDLGFLPKLRFEHRPISPKITESDIIYQATAIFFKKPSSLQAFLRPLYALALGIMQNGSKEKEGS
jgi:hypothetical protein